MNKKVYIKQDGTIPGYRIIKELERRGGINEYNNIGLDDSGVYYYISFSSVIIYSNSMGAASIELLIEQGYTKLLYNKETDSFYSNIGKLLEGEYEIPEGYEITIEGGKLIVRKKKWHPQKGDMVWTVVSFPFGAKFSTHSIELDDGEPKDGDVFFRFEEEAQAFCDKLNAAIKPILEEKRKEVEA